MPVLLSTQLLLPPPSAPQFFCPCEPLAFRHHGPSFFPLVAFLTFVCLPNDYHVPFPSVPPASILPLFRTFRGDPVRRLLFPEQSSVVSYRLVSQFCASGFL